MGKRKLSQGETSEEQKAKAPNERPDERSFLIKEAVDRAVQEYGETLKKLSKND
jgi:hypothetical protein